MENSKLELEDNAEQQLYGVSTQTFVRQYKVQSQMNPNLINGINVSSKAVRLLEEIEERDLLKM